MSHDTTTPYITTERRKDIVSRLDGATSRVNVARIKTEDELAFAIRFLTDHFIYKRSKGEGVVNDAAVRNAGLALAAALDSMVEDIASPQDIDMDVVFGEDPVPARSISRLGEGQISNPFDFIK